MKRKKRHIKKQLEVEEFNPENFPKETVERVEKLNEAVMSSRPIGRMQALTMSYLADLQQKMESSSIDRQIELIMTHASALFFLLGKYLNVPCCECEGSLTGNHVEDCNMNNFVLLADMINGGF